MITAHQTAILLAVILNRSEQSRARVSAKTIKLLAIRRMKRRLTKNRDCKAMGSR